MDEPRAGGWRCPSTRHRSDHAEHALRRDCERRRVQEHQQRRQLERGQHGPARNSYVVALAIDPTTPSTLYAGTAARACSRAPTAAAAGGGQHRPAQHSRLRAGHRSDHAEHALRRDGRRRACFKSTDGGGSWSAVNTGLPNAYVHALAIDPTTPSTLYAGTVDGGVFKSTDGGGSWSAVNTGLADIPAVVQLGHRSRARRARSTRGSWRQRRLFKSTDSGGSWSAVNTGLTAPSTSYALAIDPTTPSTLYAGTDRGSGVFKSTDGGGSWSAVNTGLRSATTRLRAGHRSDHAEHALRRDGRRRRVQEHRRRQQLERGQHRPGRHRTSRALAIDPTTPSTLYAGTGGDGVFKSTDSGGSWRRSTRACPTLHVDALAIDPTTPSTLYAGT